MKFKKVIAAAWLLMPVLVFAGLETATYIDQLNVANPTGTDHYSTADDHLRLIKSTIKNTFPNINGALTGTDEQINALTALTGTVWTSTTDGAGSTLDADLLDGNSSAFFLSASNLNAGTLPDARFPATLPAISGVNLTALPATLPASSGVNLTALNATQLTSGTVPDARFPATLPALSGANLTALNATNIASGTLAVARLHSSVWTSTNDGAGSGLDADTLDGSSSAAFAAASHNHAASNITSGQLAVAQGGTGRSDALTPNISSKAGINKTLSSSTPSGGSDGDIWYRY